MNARNSEILDKPGVRIKNNTLISFTSVDCLLCP